MMLQQGAVALQRHDFTHGLAFSPSHQADRKAFVSTIKIYLSPCACTTKATVVKSLPP